MAVMPKRNGKDTVFTDLFSQPKYVLELYHALHPEDTAATEDQIEIVTLQNVLTDNIYNDLGFMVGNRLIVLVEAQSTWTVNILIRMLLYLAQSYREYIDRESVNLYGSKKAKLPKPELYVIYTGERGDHPKYLTLSEEFFGGLPGAVDVRAKILYGGDTRDIIGQYVRYCKVLDQQVRIYGRVKKAVVETLRICREENVLEEYLMTREKEVGDIMITLFSQERIQKIYEKELIESCTAEAMEKGMEKGRAEGMEKGRAEGMKKGMEKGMEKGIFATLTDLVRKGLLSLANAAEQAHMSEADFAAAMG